MRTAGESPPGWWRSRPRVDRAIIMSPQKANARVLIPVAFLEDILTGYPVDFLLYANNYEQVDEFHPVIDPLPTPEAALQVFREGAAMAKGTTTSTGLGHSYFANIFGPPQYRDRHEELAGKTFETAFRTGTFVGQLRTRLPSRDSSRTAPRKQPNPSCGRSGRTQGARGFLPLPSRKTLKSKPPVLYTGSGSYLRRGLPCQRSADAIYFSVYPHVSLKTETRYRLTAGDVHRARRPLRSGRGGRESVFPPNRPMGLWRWLSNAAAARPAFE